MASGRLHCICLAWRWGFRTANSMACIPCVYVKFELGVKDEFSFEREQVCAFHIV